MEFPVRCFTCGAVIADKYEEYKEKVDAGGNPADVLDKLGVKRYCCRRMFIAQVDAVEEVIRHGKF